MTKRRVCNDKHPIKQKLDKLVDFCNELNISIEFYGSAGTVLTDNETGQQFYYEDLESSEYPMSGFPPACEYKLVIKE